MSYPIPDNEVERLEALRATGIMHTGASPEFDAIAELASAIFDAPMAVVAFIEDDFQWFKAHLGLDIDKTSREVSFCKYTILQNEALVVNDATKDERFRDNPDDRQDRSRAAPAIDLWPAQSLPLRFILRLAGELQHHAATSRHSEQENAPRSFCESN